MASRPASPEPLQTRRRCVRAARCAPPRCCAATAASAAALQLQAALQQPGRAAGSREKRAESTRIEPPPTESISATSAVMAVVLAVGLAALCSGETNAKGGER